MNSNYNYSRTLYKVTFSLFLIHVIILIICFVYSSIQIYSNKTVDIIKNNEDSFQNSIIYRDRANTIGNTIESMTNAGTISSYLVVHDGSILSKSSTYFYCDKMNNLFHHNYIKENKLDGGIFLGYLPHNLLVCYKKYFFNNVNYKIGYIQISVPVKPLDFYNFFMFILAVFVVFIIVYLFLILYLRRYFKVLSNSTMLTHDIVEPFTIVENSLRNKIDFNINKNINLIKDMKYLVQYIIDKYIYEKQIKIDKVYFNVKELIENCFLTVSNIQDFKVDYEIQIKSLLQIRMVQEDMYLIILNLIKNGIQAVKNNGFNKIKFDFDMDASEGVFCIKVSNNNSFMSNNNIKNFLGNTKRIKFGNNGNGSYIILKSVENNGGTLNIESDYENKNTKFIIKFLNIETRIASNSRENLLYKEKESVNEILKIIVIDDEDMNLNEWKSILSGHEFVFYKKPDKFFEDIIFKRIDINNYDVIISDYIFKSDKTNSVVTANSIKIGYKLKKKYGYKGVLILSSSISDTVFDEENLKEEIYFDANMNNKFLEIDEIYSLVLKFRERN